MEKHSYLEERILRIALDFRRISSTSYSVHRIPYTTGKELDDLVDLHREEHSAWYDFDSITESDCATLQYVDYNQLEQLKIV